MRRLESQYEYWSRRAANLGSEHSAGRNHLLEELKAARQKRNALKKQLWRYPTPRNMANKALKRKRADENDTELKKNWLRAVTAQRNRQNLLANRAHVETAARNIIEKAVHKWVMHTMHKPGGIRQRKLAAEIAQRGNYGR